MDESQSSSATSGFVCRPQSRLVQHGAGLGEDIYPGLNDAMKSVAGHHWTTHGVVDLVLLLGWGDLHQRATAKR